MLKLIGVTKVSGTDGLVVSMLRDDFAKILGYNNEADMKSKTKIQLQYDTEYDVAESHTRLLKLAEGQVVIGGAITSIRNLADTLEKYAVPISEICSGTPPAKIAIYTPLPDEERTKIEEEQAQEHERALEELPVQRALIR